MYDCNCVELCEPGTSIRVLVKDADTAQAAGYFLPGLTSYTGDMTALVKCPDESVATGTLLVNDGGIGVSRPIDPANDILLHDANVSPMDFPSCETVADANDLVMKNPDDGLLWVRNAGVKTVFGGHRTVPIQDLNTYTVGQEVTLESPNCREFPAHPDQTMQYMYHPNHMTTSYVLQPGWRVRVDAQTQVDGGAWGTLQAIRIDTTNNTVVEIADVVQNDETAVLTVQRCSPREVCARIRITVELAGNPGVNTIRPRGSRIVAIGGTLV